MIWPDMYITGEFDCPYFPERTARNIIPDPAAEMSPALHDSLSEQGFRRSGEHLYLPRCPGCSACCALRVRAVDFRPRRTDRRLLRAHADTRVRLTDPGFDAEAFALYRDYLATRHPGGGMDDPAPEEFPGFLAASWSRTRFVRFERAGRLLAVLVMDELGDGLSAVYTFYDPEARRLAPGRHAILWLIAETQRRGLDWTHLGYWIPGHPKMDYKARYRPAEICLRGHGWVPLDDPLIEMLRHHPPGLAAHSAPVPE